MALMMDGRIISLGDLLVDEARSRDVDVIEVHDILSQACLGGERRLKAVSVWACRCSREYANSCSCDPFSLGDFVDSVLIIEGIDQVR